MVASSYNSSSAFDKGLPRLDEEDSHCQHSCPRSVLEYALHSKKRRSELLHFLMFQSTNVDFTFPILFHLTSPHLRFPLPHDPLYLCNSIHTFLPSLDQLFIPTFLQQFSVSSPCACLLLILHSIILPSPPPPMQYQPFHLIIPPLNGSFLFPLHVLTHGLLIPTTKQNLAFLHFTHASASASQAAVTFHENALHLALHASASASQPAVTFHENALHLTLHSADVSLIIRILERERESCLTHESGDVAVELDDAPDPIEMLSLHRNMHPPIARVPIFLTR